MNFDNLRAAIPAFRGVSYMNWGAAGPSPTSVVDAVAAVLREESARTPYHPEVRAARQETFGVGARRRPSRLR